MYFSYLLRYYELKKLSICFNTLENRLDLLPKQLYALATSDDSSLSMISTVKVLSGAYALMNSKYVLKDFYICESIQLASETPRYFDDH